MSIGFGKFILSDEQNQWDLGILQWFVGTIVYLSMSVYAYGWKGQPWDPIGFGTGLFGVLAAGAALKWIRDKSPAVVSSQETTLIQKSMEVNNGTSQISIDKSI